jgi:hypothetical protein
MSQSRKRKASDSPKSFAQIHSDEAKAANAKGGKAKKAQSTVTGTTGVFSGIDVVLVKGGGLSTMRGGKLKEKITRLGGRAILLESPRLLAPLLGFSSEHAHPIIAVDLEGLNGPVCEALKSAFAVDWRVVSIAWVEKSNSTLERIGEHQISRGELAKRRGDPNKSS